MTVVELKKDGKRRELTITGHAEHSRPDIVCSAVSVLTYTLAAGLTNADFKTYSGYARICIDDTGQEDEVVIKTIMKGFALLAEEYPQNVRVVSNE